MIDHVVHTFTTRHERDHSANCFAHSGRSSQQLLKRPKIWANELLFEFRKLRCGPSNLDTPIPFVTLPDSHCLQMILNRLHQQMLGLGWINGNHTASSLLLQASSIADENRSLCLQMKVRPLDMFVCCTQDDLLEVYSQGRYSSRRTMSIPNTVEK